MSAQIYIHPRSSEAVQQVSVRFMCLGYVLRYTRRGHIEAVRVPVLRNVVQLPKRKQ